MLIQCEKKLIHKGYVNTHDKNSLLSYHKKGEPFKQFNIQMNNNKYKVSFPIGDDQYTTTIKEKNEMIKYVKYILNQHGI